MKTPVSVCYCGCNADASGYGESNRNHIRALHEAKVNLTVQTVSYTEAFPQAGENYELARKLDGKGIDYDIKIIHVPSDGYIKLLEPTKYHIGHLFWETDSLSKTWVWNCNRMDEIWTGGVSQKETFLRSGVKVPIYIFSQPVDTNIEPQKPFEIPGHKGYLFYSIFQWIERKNPKALLETYWREFDGEEKVSLLLKTFRFGYNNKEIEAIKKDINEWKKVISPEIKQFPRVLLFSQLISQQDIIKFHSTGDCFVSAHRGEGWGIPQCEAMVLGKPIISTNLGGAHEWMEDNKTAYLVKWQKTSVFNMDFAPWYDKYQNWAEVDQKDLQSRMRHVFDNPDKGMYIGKQGQELVKSKFNYETVGKMMADRLIEIQNWINK